MKTAFRPLQALLFASLATPLLSLAQVPETIPGSVSDVVLNLTVSYTGPGTVVKDESGKIVKGEEGGPDFFNEWQVYKGEKLIEEASEYLSKAKTEKYSNKEFLTDLVELGVIEEIAGWSIKLAMATLENEPVVTSVENAMSGYVKIYLVHKNTAIAPIPVNQYVDLTFGASAATVTNKVSTKFNAQEEPLPTTRTYTSTVKQMTLVELNLSDETISEEFMMTGVYTGGEKLTALGKDKIPVITANAGKIGGISGSYYYEDEAEEMFFFDVVEGSITIGAGLAKADLSNYPGILEADPEPASF